MDKAFAVGMIAVWVAAIIGWLVNLVAGIKALLTLPDITTLGVVHVVGIFLAPLGSIMGWLHLFKVL